MTAVLFLSSVETRIVLEGALGEPGWRPRPGSSLDRAETKEEYEQLLAARDRLAAREPLQQTVAAKYWARWATDTAILISSGHQESAALGVARVQSGKRARRRGVRYLDVGPWRLFDAPVAVEPLLSQVSKRSATMLRLILASGEARLLPPSAGVDFLRALRQQVERFDGLVESLPPAAHRYRRAVSSMARLDANQSALRFFSRAWRTLQPIETPETSDFAVEIELAARGSENDYITDDTTGFLDWDRSKTSHQGWFEFRSGARRLHVKNLNVSTAENQTGADLVYVSREPDVVVLVQYKLMGVLTESGEPIFRDDGRLGSQVDRLLKLSASSIDRGAEEANSRLGPDFGFVKFVVPDDAGWVREGQLPQGNYYPVDAVRRMLLHPDVGPKGGEIYYVTRRRSIDGETFARLVRDRWIGSTGNTTDLVLRTLGVMPSRFRNQLTMAVEEPNCT